MTIWLDAHANPEIQSVQSAKNLRRLKRKWPSDQQQFTSTFLLSTEKKIIQVNYNYYDLLIIYSFI